MRTKSRRGVRPLKIFHQPNTHSRGRCLIILRVTRYKVQYDVFNETMMGSARNIARRVAGYLTRTVIRMAWVVITYKSRRTRNRGKHTQLEVIFLLLL